MAKRARVGAGAAYMNDLNPQFMTLLTGAAVAVNDYTVNRINLPVARLGGRKGKATVIEVLKVFWYLSLRDLADAQTDQWCYLTTNTIREDGDTSTLTSAVIDASDAQTMFFALWHKGVLGATGGHNMQFPIVIDVTDGEGNGVLLGTDQIFIVAGGAGNTTGSDAVAKVLYRFKEVGIEEYVGIVQSQQG